MDNPTIKQMYKNITYFDQYGASVILFVIITIVLLILISYCFVKINSQSIIDDWVNQRCKPSIMPFAGYITHPEGTSAFEYTAQNFNYCMQNILSSTAGTALEPLTFVTTMLSNTAGKVKDDLQSIRAMFDKIRVHFQDISQEIMGRIMNITIPLQQIIISFKDVLAKIQGTMTAGLFTLLGSYYALKSLMGAIAQFIISILIALAAMIAVFWVIPFTQGVAIANTVIFVAIAIPMSIILAFMVDVLHVQTSLKIPSVKCFDENTLIKMNNGVQKRIIDIRIGDILQDNNIVTACIKVEAKGSTMYIVDNIIVSDSHIVWDTSVNTWLQVAAHSGSIQLTPAYDKPFLYCLNTSNKTIVINNTIFTDWDEVYNNTDFEKLKLQCQTIMATEDIHTYLDGGFEKNTLIQLLSGNYKPIHEIKVGDILSKGEKVYGIVEIDGRTVCNQFNYNLGKNMEFKGGPNIPFIGTIDYTKEMTSIKDNSLYHLLTDSKTFYIGIHPFYDYNAAIDLLL